jgi:hypothetical protein
MNLELKKVSILKKKIIHNIKMLIVHHKYLNHLYYLKNYKENYHLKLYKKLYYQKMIKLEKIKIKEFHIF